MDISRYRQVKRAEKVKNRSNKSQAHLEREVEGELLLLLKEYLIHNDVLCIEVKPEACASLIKVMDQQKAYSYSQRSANFFEIRNREVLI